MRPVYLLLHELGEPRVIANGIEERVALVPWIAGEPGGRRLREPAKGDGRVAKLRVHGPKAVGGVVVELRFCRDYDLQTIIDAVKKAMD